MTCTLIVALWLVMARQSGQSFKPFDLTARDFEGFEPFLTNGSVRPIPVSASDPAEPNIAAYVVESGERRAGRGKRQEGSSLTINHEPLTIQLLTRLVHGYNMPMCMKIKGYTVEEYGNLKPETRNLSHTKPNNHGIHKNAHSNLTSQVSSSTALTQVSGITSQVSSPIPIQLWRVISSDGERSIWVTTMIRAGDFSPTLVDICSMAFPRVDVPDDPGWIPRGLTWASLRHPVASLKQWGRARWNASRTDLLTFLRLRQPAWASEELLTYVTCSIDPAVKSDNEVEIERAVVLAHTEMLEVLRVWRIAQVGMK